MNPPDRSPPAQTLPDWPPPAVAAERTRLAWRRLALTSTGVVLVYPGLLARAGAGGWRLVLLTTVLAAWLGLIAAAQRRIGAIKRGAGAPGPVPVAIAALVAWYAVAGVALVLTVRGH